MGNCMPKEEDSKGSQIPSGNLNTNMLREREGNVEKKYEIVRMIGEGSMGSISQARIRANKIGGSAYQPQRNEGGLGRLFGKGHSDSFVPNLAKEDRRQEIFYALKTIQLSRISETFVEELKNEIDILKTLDHPNCVKAYEVFENKTQIYIVMDLNSGGDLYRRVPYSEKQSASIVGKLLSAIKYMHDKGIVHRDLKFENIMWESDSEDAEIKVIDFGLSKKFLPHEHRTMTEGVGTIYTMAPQVLQGIYTSQADLWSVGVIAFMLLGSQKPFYHKRRRRVIDKIMRADYQYRGLIWEEISKEGKDFIDNLLVLDPKKRMNATKALSHKWLDKEFSLSDRRPDESLMDSIENNLLQYKYQSDFKKIALNVIAHRSSAEEIVSLRKAFDQYDSKNDGNITFAEFKQALEKSNYSDEEMVSIFESIDINKNGMIMYTEFLAATLEVQGSIEEERIAEAFDRIDADDSGYISKENLRQLLGKGATKSRLNALIEEADTDKDGQISFTEFRQLFRKNKNDLASQVGYLDSSVSTFNENELVGLDAKIPGGKYDQ